MQELSFIESLQEKPADDELRLVYADWLEENFHTSKAEYVRLELQLTQALEQQAGITHLLPPFVELVGQVPNSWLNEVGVRISTQFVSYLFTSFELVLRSVRAATGVKAVKAREFMHRAKPILPPKRKQRRGRNDPEIQDTQRLLLEEDYRRFLSRRQGNRPVWLGRNCLLGDTLLIADTFYARTIEYIPKCRWPHWSQRNTHRLAHATLEFKREG